MSNLGFYVFPCFRSFICFVKTLVVLTFDRIPNPKPILFVCVASDPPIQKSIMSLVGQTISWTEGKSEEKPYLNSNAIQFVIHYVHYIRRNENIYIEREVHDDEVQDGRTERKQGHR